MGATPEVLSADAGYWSAANDEHVEKRAIDAYIAVRRQKHNEAPAGAPGDPEPTASVVQATAAPEVTTTTTVDVASPELEPGSPAGTVDGSLEAPTGGEASPPPLDRKKRMATKLATERGRALYARRKAIVEPPFGHIKANRGFRQFLLRDIEQVRGE